MKNLFAVNLALEDSGELPLEQFAELSEFFLHRQYANEGGEFLNDEIRTTEQEFDDEESFLDT